MKGKIIILTALFLLVMTVSAFAANWQFSYSTNDNGEKISYYFETTTVTRSNDGKNFYFWIAQVFEYQDKTSTAKEIWYYNEVTIASPHYRRQLEDYGYDAKRNELWHNTNPTDWRYVHPGSSNEGMINAALRYAK